MKLQPIPSTTHSPEEWIEKLRRKLKRLEELEADDRLSYMLGVKACNNAVAQTVGGWAYWVRENPKTFLLLSDEDMRILFESYRIITCQLLQLDIETTVKTVGEKPAKKKGKQGEPRSIV